MRESQYVLLYITWDHNSHNPVNQEFWKNFATLITEFLESYYTNTAFITFKKLKNYLNTPSL